MRILLVEDDQPTRLTVTEILHTHDYDVDCASDGEIALRLTETKVYDLILLDICLPKLDGIELCKRLRSTNYSSPILLLTAQSSTPDRVLGLDAGADGYLTKPFETEELLARIRVLLRRGKVTVNPVLTWQNIQLDAIASKVTCRDHHVPLTQKEFQLLELFLVNPNRTFSRSVILDRLWDESEFPGEETISTHIKCIRRKLKALGCGDPIETVHRLGYRLRVSTAEVERSHHPVSPEQIQAKTTELWKKFEGSFLEQMSTLENLLKSPSSTSDSRQIAKDIAHKLAGSLGIFGFIESSRIAKELETTLQLEEEDISCDLVDQLRRSLQKNAVPKKQSILIVDDDLAVLERLSSLLQGLEIQIITLDQSHQFWQVLAESQPMLLLLDLEMPNCNGLELCRAVRSDPKWQDLAIVILSSTSESQILETVLAAGADDYCNKSAPATEILSRILHQLDVKN